MKQRLKTLINGIINFINDKFISKLNDAFEVSIPTNKITKWVGIAGKSGSIVTIPDIPRLYTGAYISANTPQLAIVGDNTHEGEFVAPESKLKAAVREVYNEGGGSSEQVALLKEQNRLLKAILDKDTGITKDEVYRAVVEKDREYTNINGHSKFVK